MTNDEMNFLKTYQAEIDGLKLPQLEELPNLYKKVEAGDQEAVSALTEYYMPKVLGMARENAGHGVHVGDLVQEGNLAVFMALGNLSEKTAEISYDEFVEAHIEIAMKMALDEDEAENAAGNHIADQLNQLAEAVEYMNQEYGDAYSLADLAEYTQMSEESIKELFKMAGEDWDSEENKEENSEQ